MTQKRAIATELALQNLLGELRQAWKASRYLRVTFSDSKPRSLPQNALAAVFYEQVARELGDQTPEDVKAENKLRIGVPILRADDEAFRDMYDTAIKGLTYEQKLKIIRWMPITSLMNTDQLTHYLEQMQKDYQARGIFLEFPAEPQ